MSGAATDTVGACYARRARIADSSLGGASSPRSVSRSMLSIAAWMLPSALLRVAAPPARPIRTRRSHKSLDGSNRAGCSQRPELPRGAAITTSTELPSRSRLRPGCSNRAAMGLGLDLRVWLLIHLEAGVARLRLASRPHRHLVRVWVSPQGLTAELCFRAQLLIVRPYRWQKQRTAKDRRR